MGGMGQGAWEAWHGGRQYCLHMLSWCKPVFLMDFGRGPAQSPSCQLAATVITQADKGQGIEKKALLLRTTNLFACADITNITKMPFLNLADICIYNFLHGRDLNELHT